MKVDKLDFNQLPKIELHCHLDGSLRTTTVLKWLREDEATQEYDDLEVFSKLLIAPENCDSLDTYLERFQIPVKVLQSEIRLTQATYELYEDAAKENVKYLEVRFAPHLHLENGLDLNRIIGAVVKGLKAAENDFEIKGNVILSYLRNTEIDGFFDMIEAGKDWLGKGVVAVDLCGGERDRFAPRFKGAFEKARSLGYAVTIHAGETGSVENIEDAVSLLGATRIGHGTAMIKDERLQKLLVEKGVFIECCPTSNVQTKAVKSFPMHPMNQYFQNGIKVTMNTDNRTVSNTTMNEEFDQMYRFFNWNDAEVLSVFKQSIEASFASDEIKSWLFQFMGNN